MAQALKRLVTGIDGLDALLKGGLIAGASYIIQGPPGAGKTILANQLACGHVRGGGRVLVATLLSESHERLFQYLSTLDFFDPALVGDKIQFVSAFDTLEQDGLDAVVRLLRQEIARQQASLLIVDGVLNARVRAETALDTKKFVSELQGHAAFAGCTVLLLTSARLDEGSPEHTMVDGVIELGEQLVGSRAVRHVQLRKTRGSGALSGRHECLIDESGMQVYPRLEALFSHPSQLGSGTLARISSGVPTFDEMLGGGLATGSVSLLMGPSGIGKTSLGLAFLGASTPQAPGLHFGFYETPERLRSKAASLGYDFAARLRDAATALYLCAAVAGAVRLGRPGPGRVGAGAAGRARPVLRRRTGKVAMSPGPCPAGLTPRGRPLGRGAVPLRVRRAQTSAPRIARPRAVARVAMGRQ